MKQVIFAIMISAWAALAATTAPRSAAVSASGALLQPTATQFMNANGIAPTNNPTFTGTAKMDNAVLKGELGASILNSGSIVLSNVQFYYTSFVAIDGYISNLWLMTNNPSGPTTVNFTNYAVAEQIIVDLPGEVSGGTDRNMTINVSTGDLLTVDGGALTTSCTLTRTNGQNLELLVYVRNYKSTNIVDIVTKRGSL